MHIKLATLMWFAFFLASVGANAEGVQYRIRDLGAYGTSASAVSINEHGQIVGNYFSSDDVQHALVWSNGVVEELHPFGSNYSVACDINDSGSVVGEYEQANGVRLAYLWKGSQYSTVGTFIDSVGVAISNSGWIAYAALKDGQMHAFALNDKDMLEVESLGGDCYAHNINNDGHIVGADNYSNAFLWRNNTMRYLGGLGGEYSFAHGINDSDWVVGEAQIPELGPHAFLWRDNVMQDIGTLGGEKSCSIARSINNFGQVVGESSVSDGWYHAFLWQNGTMLDLGTLGGDSSVAYAINDNGCIVGSAADESGQLHAVLWEPVPEPSSILALLCGIAGAGRMIVKKSA